MPFVKKNASPGSQAPADACNIFIGRTNELHFFVQNILQPEDPTHNIVSIFGQGGVGKSTLLARFIDEAHSPPFKDFCRTAIVDERQTIPVTIMERFADQLRLKGRFEKALRQYKETLRKLQTERDAMQETMLHRIPDFAGAAAEGVPIAGPLLREGIKVGTKYLVDRYRTDQIRRDAELLVDPLTALTTAFVEELNRLVDSYVTLRPRREKRQQRVLLFFDTFEQLAVSGVPWLLDYFLPAPISNNVVLVIAGRDSLDHSLPNDLKGWLPYYEHGNIYSMPLKSFTEDEARAYLAERGITDPARIATIWQLSSGLPLYLGLLTANPSGEVDPTEDVVINFLRWIPEQEVLKRKLALDAALFSAPFNQDDLAAFSSISDQERSPLFHWLTRQPFVQRQDGRYRYHHVAQELFSRHLFLQSPKEYTLMRRTLADHYQRLSEENQVGGDEGSARWVELVLAQVHQLFLLPEEAAHIQAIQQILRAYRWTNDEYKRTDISSEIIKAFHELSGEQYLKQTASGSREYVQLLLRLMGASLKSSQEDLVAARSAAGPLLEMLVNAASFPKELLALVYGRRGWIHDYLKEYEQAIADFNCALEFDPKDIDLYYGLAWAYRQLNDFRSSIATYDRALNLGSKVAITYNARGWAYHLAGETKLALVDFDHALGLDPKMESAYTGRGWVHVTLKEYEQAIVEFNRALDLDSNWSEACHGRAYAYFLLKEYQQALADFDHYIEEIDKENPWIYLRRGMACASLKNHQQALVDFNRAFALDPKDKQIYLYTQVYFYQGKEPDLGIATELEAITAAEPLRYWAHICRGVAMWIRKNYEDALIELEQALQRRPKSWDPYFWRGMVCVSLEQEEEAMKAIKKALEEGMPPILLAPLNWFEQEMPNFYRKYAMPLLAKYA